MANNPIGPDYATKKYVTRGGKEPVQLVCAKEIGLTTQNYLWCPQTNMLYEHTIENGNLVFPETLEEDWADIVAEYKEPD